MTKSFAKSKFRGSAYTMVRNVSIKNVLLHLYVTVIMSHRMFFEIKYILKVIVQSADSFHTNYTLVRNVSIRNVLLHL